MQTACDDALSQLPDVRTVLGAPRSTHSSGRPQPRRGSKPSAASHPTLPAPAVPTHPQTDAAPHTAAVVAAAVPTAKRTAPAASRHETRVTVRSHDLRPVRTKPAPSLTALRPDTPVREAADSERPGGTERLPLFLVALLLGLASLALALRSLRLRRGAALTAVTTRVRSKGLSSAARPRPNAGEEDPPAIRYRE